MGRSLNNQNRIYSFKRTTAIQPYTINAEGNEVAQTVLPFEVSNYVSAGKFTFGHFRFQLNDIPSHADFTNLYERYKITGVKLKFIPTQGTACDVDRPTSDSKMAPLAIAINRGAAVTSAYDRDFAQTLENQDAKIYTAMKPFSVYIPYPKFYAPADGVVAAQEKSGWISTRTPAIAHFGLNWAYQTTTTNEYLYTTFRVYATYYIKCCNPQ